MTTSVRIAHFSGIRHATLIKRAGQWAVTAEGSHEPCITHLPTGYKLPGSDEIGAERRERLLDMLERLPAMDLQALDVPLLKGLLAASGGERG